MHRRYDHNDLRVRNLSEARWFYEVLLPALGFTRDTTIEGWLQFGSDKVGKWGQSPIRDFHRPQ